MLTQITVHFLLQPERIRRRLRRGIDCNGSLHPLPHRRKLKSQGHIGPALGDTLHPMGDLICSRK